MKKHDIFFEPPFDKFRDFIKSGNDRFAALCSILSVLDFHYSVVEIDGCRHFFVSSKGRERPRSVLVAHYDVVPGSPGANDNAASVFMLIKAALELKNGASAWMIVFTDKEEAGAGGIQAQGSYSLAKKLKNTDIAGSSFYIFDVCGRGETVIISTMADYLMKSGAGGQIARRRKNLNDLRNNTMIAAGASFNNKIMLLPAPFSDDAGFLHAGLSAQMITVLPAAEAAAFASLSRTNPSYITALVKKESRYHLDMKLIPETWRLINGPQDTESNLTPENFPGIIKFASALALSKY